MISFNLNLNLQNLNIIIAYKFNFIFSFFLFEDIGITTSYENGEKVGTYNPRNITATFTGINWNNVNLRRFLTVFSNIYDNEFTVENLIFNNCSINTLFATTSIFNKFKSIQFGSSNINTNLVDDTLVNDIFEN